MKTQLLIIDDDVSFAEDLMLLLEEDFDCLVSHDPGDGLATMRRVEPDVVLLDLMFDDAQNGLDVLDRIQQDSAETPVIMITDHSSISTAVEAMRKGAFDYISKSPDMEELRLLIQKSLEQKRLRAQAQTLQEEVQSPYYKIIGNSEVMQSVRAKIALYADNLNTVLITGESGVGKELVARQIHLKSDRQDKPFLAINCAALPNQLLESELFGHEKGAFTGADSRKIGKFEIASDGIIFFDEVSELSPESQAKLLRVLQEKEFERLGGTATIQTDAKVICATNKDLRACVEDGEFREDLYYRLDVLPLQVPPLRERRDDIPELVLHFIERACLEMKKPVKEISDEALQQLIDYDWPGNIRELRNFLTRAVLLAQGSDLGLHNLPELRPASMETSTAGGVIPKTWVEMDELRKSAAEEASRDVERRFITYLLEKFEGNVTRAAEFAGIHRTNFHKIMKRCGI